ncbi:MAG: sensor histidine kinase [Sphingobium sp.]
MIEDMDEDEERSIPPIMVLYSILGFWLFYMALVTLRSFVMGFDAQAPMAIRRSIVTVIGIVVTWALYLVVRRFDRASLTKRTLVAFSAAIPCSIIIALANSYLFYFYDPAGLFPDMAKEKLIIEQGYALKEIAEFAIGRYFFLSAWAALYLAISYAAEVRRVERRAARLEKAAQQAELRSLRYQVNPHFLFNTLNSLSSLIMVNRQDEAERMIMSLSNFYRASLTGDPLEDVPLSEEVHLQKLYLDIEAVRFPDRLRTLIDIPPHVMDCCVPGLILQPLIENAIKYGVARRSLPVTIAIFAREEDDLLMVSVRNDGDVLPEDHDRGGGIGLANVRDRLAARFGANGKLNARHLDGGGFMVELTMPIIRRGC